MPEKKNPLFPDREPERPLECTECKKTIAIRYTEISGNAINHISMCADCPELKKKLYGVQSYKEGGVNLGDGGTNLACGNCDTTLEEVRIGSRMGCSTCYEVFGEALLADMVASNKIPARLAGNKKSILFHIGRTPQEAPIISSSLRLLALNEALTETLQREDYEQAALLRDQIKELTKDAEKKHEEK
ncbi:UvrB/UvrC motif-containing protein [Parachlamydia sp. AcF125]|uniref:UvrB/UvrC motif-containing protein n=1 Tax=Parachlamydia sp. AcF125 TaxID=2795736 RepID=UPI001BCA5B0A|nr:UvrB/UvrC motif-containing protein [Parachlamydia sp. AcF125]MBS4167799.1 Protein-arginine kinase activator protein [Parachlamydia sp. AcF125]